MHLWSLFPSFGEGWYAKDGSLCYDASRVDITPQMCCPDREGNGGMPLCFDEIYTLDLCCYPGAFFREGGTFHPAHELLLGYAVALKTKTDSMSANLEAGCITEIIKDTVLHELVMRSYHDETTSEEGQRDYRGGQQYTIGGLSCQRWDAQAPHAHEFTPENFPEDGLHDNNYCRNPAWRSKEKFPRIWCYTMDPDVRWDFCVPQGEDKRNCAPQGEDKRNCDNKIPAHEEGKVKPTFKWLEVGVYKGTFAKRMMELLTMPHRKPGLRLDEIEYWGIDSWIPNQFDNPDNLPPDGSQLREAQDEKGGTAAEHMKGAIDSIAEFWGKNTRLMQLSSLEALPLFPDGSLDFIFVDGDHTFEGALADLLAYWPKVSHRGILVAHDYLIAEVQHAVQVMLEQLRNGLAHGRPRNETVAAAVVGTVNQGRVAVFGKGYEEASFMPPSGHTCVVHERL